MRLLTLSLPASRCWRPPNTSVSPPQLSTGTVTKTSSSVNGSGVHEARAIRFGRASTVRVFIGSGGSLRV
ncbi:hypothetical protein GCM10009783_17210 [Glycomyces lechevalierae]